MDKTIDGVRLAFDDDGSGEALVLLHGFLLDRAIWQAQATALARQCRVIRLDLRGSGESECGPGPALMETLAGDVFGLLDALGVERAIIAGHSLGAYVALAFFRMYAERVAGLALVSGHIGADTPAQRARRDMAIAAFEAQGSNAGAIAQLIGMKERVGSEDLLEDIGVPALIIAGADDPQLDFAALEATAAALADCELVRVPGAGRLVMIEAPAATTDALARLVTRCARASADPQSGRATRV
jgi:pimeloyl-ACP methyl ester carboxylesterase